MKGRYHMARHARGTTGSTIAQDPTQHTSAAAQAASERASQTMLRQLRPAIVITLVLTIITGMVYPLATLGVGQALFPSQANGSLIYVNGKAIGSTLIGQYWTQP